MKTVGGLGKVFAASLLIISSIFASTGFAQTCSVNIPHVTGEWSTLPYPMPINPVLLALLPNGKVLIVAGSENDALNGSGTDTYRYATWDPTNLTESEITVNDFYYDLFCSGSTLLPDGRSMVVGGTASYGFTGDNRASIFDPLTGEFLQTQNMANGRWYANVTELGDGRLMTFSGFNSYGGTNNTVEIYDPSDPNAGWGTPVKAPFVPPLFPKVELLPNGTVIFTGHGLSDGGGTAWIFDPETENWTASAPVTMDRSNGSAVLLSLLPPEYIPKIMNFGGGANTATNTTEIIDLSIDTPKWTPGPKMSAARTEMNAVLLPNGEVLAEGGSAVNEVPDDSGKMTDLYNPVTNTMSSAGTATYSRLYHSSALLLPDATVVSAGSNPGPRGRYEPAIEIYRPPYLFDSTDRLITNRPNITNITPSKLGYNANFSVSYTSSATISSAVLMRLGSVTHTFDMGQRLIGLCGPAPQPPCNGASGTGTLSLTTPPTGNIAPPGYYMLFLLDSRGVPSIANFLQLSAFGTTPPRGVISSPASDTTIQVGGAVNFGTSTIASKYSWVFPGGTPSSSNVQNPGNITFNTPGTYNASLTVVDNTGNSDFSPPSRSITVMPKHPDFSIAVIPNSSNTVLPGQSATYKVTVTPVSGFKGTVNLSVGSESGFPAGFSGSFSPTSITGGGGTSTLTMHTTTATAPYALSLTISGAQEGIIHRASTTLTVTMLPPSSLKARPGNAQVSLSWQPSISAKNYHVKRSTVSGGPYVTIACTTGTSFTDTGLANGTTYYYVVSASYNGGANTSGESGDSSQVSATPSVPPPLPPVPPKVLKAVTGSIKGTVILKWTQYGSPTITENDIYRRLRSVKYSTKPSLTINASTTYTDSKLTSGKTYCYEIDAVNKYGTSVKSNESCAKAK